jgi:polyferredoxin
MRRIRMSIEKARDYFVTFILFVVLIALAGAFFPQYFGAVSQILLDNLGTFLLLVILSIIIYVIANRVKEM